MERSLKNKVIFGVWDIRGSEWIIHRLSWNCISGWVGCRLLRKESF